MKKLRFSETTKAIIIICVLILSGNIVLGTFMLERSRTMMKTMINYRMLDISNTAAAMLDGDVLKDLAAGDEGTPGYRHVYDTLRFFQDNIELEFIYTVRNMGNGAFIFLVDPAEENASEYGELVTVTEALKNASLGTPSVDKEPYQDQWGRFYSAYSPVRDSEGHIVGVVVVDFSAAWYDEQLAKYANTVLITSALSLSAGILVVLIFTARLRGKLRSVGTELDTLSGEIEGLVTKLSLDPGSAARTEEEKAARSGNGSKDEISELGRRVGAMRAYLDRQNKKDDLHTNSTISALSAEYNGIYYIDIDNDEGVCCRVHSKLKNGLGEGEVFTFHETMRNYADQYVEESCREDFLKFLTPEVLRETVINETTASLRYTVVRDGQRAGERIFLAALKQPAGHVGHIVHALAIAFSDAEGADAKRPG